jgi:hypothetical protein
MPNGDRAQVDWPKVVEYLLSPAHDVGYRNAAFFAVLGYRQSDAGELVEHLLEIARTGRIVETRTDVYGTRYVVDGLLPARTRPPVPLRTVWMVEHGGTIPRRITTYPA